MLCKEHKGNYLGVIKIDSTKGNLSKGNYMFSNKDLRNLIIPLVIEQILVMLVGIIDTMMISYVGEEAISGVALVDMVNMLIITILAALATGGAVIVSQYIGSKNTEMANRSASQLITISALLSTIVTVFTLVFHKGILNVLYGSVDAGVMNAAVTYFIISALSFPFLGVYNSAAALFRSMRKTNITMYVSLIMNAINVIGNAIGIFILKAGVMGVAVPTLIARAVAAIIMFVLLLKNTNEVSIKIKEVFSWSSSVIKRILKIAVPNGIENGLFMLGKVLVTSIVALFGTTQIAANGVSHSINMFAIIVVSAMNLAIVTVIGQCVGAKEYDQAKYYTKKMMGISYIATGVLTLLVWVLLPVLLGLYELSAETYSLSYTLIMMHNIMAFALHPTSFNLSNSLRASGDVKYTMYVGIGSMIIFRLGTAYLFGIVLNMGIIGVTIAMGADWLARSVAFVIRYKSEKWKTKRAI